jgi:hypothetical protein
MMKQFKRVCFFIFIVLCQIGCGQKSASKQETAQTDVEVQEKPVSAEIKKETMPVDNYMQWVRDPQNGLIKTKTIDELQFKVQYKPYEYIVCMEERNDKIADTLMKRKLKELEGMQYYDLKILLKNNEGELLKSGLTSAEEYDSRVKYFSFGMQQDIQLVDGTDTLPCVMYHFERAYDATPVCTVLLGFDWKDSNAGKAKTLLVYDKTFNKGLLKFTFKENRLQTLPKLLTL